MMKPFPLPSPSGGENQAALEAHRHAQPQKNSQLQLSQARQALSEMPEVDLGLIEEMKMAIASKQLPLLSGPLSKAIMAYYRH